MLSVLPVAVARVLLLVCCFGYSQIALAQTSAGPGFMIYDMQSEAQLTLEDMVEQLVSADVVFFGETHNDSVAHALQDSLYGLMLRRYGEVSLSLEMFETDVQHVVDEYLEGFIDFEKLRVDGRAWGNYETDYHPLVERARGSGQRVVAANAPHRYVRLVGRRGAEALTGLPEQSRTFLPKKPYAFVDTAYQNRFLRLMGEMAGHGLGTAMSPLFAAQQLWDATMAQSIYTAYRASRRRRTKVLHINGSFHSDYRQGTVSQLQRLNRRLDLVTISAVRMERLDEVDWSQHVGLADFVILTVY